MSCAPHKFLGHFWIPKQANFKAFCRFAGLPGLRFLPCAALAPNPGCPVRRLSRRRWRDGGSIRQGRRGSWGGGQGSF